MGCWSTAATKNAAILARFAQERARTRDDGVPRLAACHCHRNLAAFLFKAQRYNRVQLGRSVCGIETRENANGPRETAGQQQSPGID